MTQEEEQHLSLTRPVIVLVGKTGTGKSTTANRLYKYWTGRDEEVFKVGCSMYSETVVSKNHLVTVAGKTYDLIDTPGIFDTCGSDELIVREITRTIQQCSHGVQAVIFCLEYGRMTQEQRDVISAVMGFFGDDVKTNLILVFSKTVNREQTINRDLLQQELLRNPPGGGSNPMKELVLAVDNRWAIAPNFNIFVDPDDENWLREADIITKQIASLARPYTTDMFERIREERERLEAERRQAEEEERMRIQLLEEEQSRLRAEAEESRMSADALRSMLEDQARERQRAEQELVERLHQQHAQHEREMQEFAREEAQRRLREQEERFQQERQQIEARVRELQEQQAAVLREQRQFQENQAREHRQELQRLNAQMIELARRDSGGGGGCLVM